MNSTGVIDGCVFSDNSMAEGGAVRALGSVVNVSNTIITRNYADLGASGIALQLQGSMPGTSYITNCTLTYGSVGANSGAGAIYVAYMGTVVLSNTVVMYNRSPGLGINRGSLEIVNSTAEVHNCTISNNVDVGVFFVLLGSLTMDKCTISNNTLTGVNLSNSSDSSISITNSWITNNGASGLNVTAVNDLDISNTTFEGNNGAQGGGMYLIDSSASLTECNFINNVANGTEGGGGICAINVGELVLINTTFIGNKATSGNGGGVYITPAGSLSCYNVEFINNSAISGGGLSIISFVYVSLSYCNFENNIALGWGGGIQTYSADYVGLSFTELSNNSAMMGGGAYFSYGQASLSNCKVHVLSCFF